MKRPLVLVGFSYLLTLAAAVYLGADVSFVLFWCCIGAFTVTFVYWRTRKALAFPLAFLSAAIALACFCVNNRMFVAPVQAMDGRDLTVTGTVCELPYQQYGRWYYIIQTDSVSDSKAPQCFKLRLSSQNGLDLEPYSRVKGKMHLSLPSESCGYSSRSYYLSRGIALFAYLYEYEGVKITPPRSLPPYGYILRLRRTMLDDIDTMLPSQEASLVKGIFLGDKTSIPEETISDFRTSGVSHLLAVSGLHMATVAELLLLLFTFLHVPGKLVSLLTGVGVFCFMAVTGFVPSVSRSGIMCLLVLGAPLISRRADSLNSLSAAVLILCIVNPWAAADVGLLLSFSATLGLILLSGKIGRYLNTKWDKIKVLSPLVQGVNGILSTSATAMLFTLPILLLNFGRLSVIAPLSNLLLLVPSTLMVSFAAIALIIGLIFPHSYLAMPFALATGLLAKYLRVCTHWLAQIPFASISVSYGFVILWLAGTVILFAVTLIHYRNRLLLKTAAWLSVIVLLVGIFSYQLSMQDVTRIAVLDVGTNLSVVLTRSGHGAVIGCEGYKSSAVTNYLSSRGISRLDYLQPLSQDGKEAANLSAAASRYSPKQLVSRLENRSDDFVRRAASHSLRCCWYRRKADCMLWDNVHICSRACSQAEAVWIFAGGVSILVLPKDADFSLLPNEWSRPDFLVTDSVNGKLTSISPLFTVYAMNGKELAEQKTQIRKAETVWTGSKGNIVLQLQSNRELSIRRETQ